MCLFVVLSSSIAFAEDFGTNLLYKFSFEGNTTDSYNATTNFDLQQFPNGCRRIPIDNSNNGTFVSGIVGSAIDIENDLLEFVRCDGDLQQLNDAQAYTFSGWFNLESGGTNREFFSVQEETDDRMITARINPNNKLELLHWNNAGSLSIVVIGETISTNQWYQYAFTYDGSTISAYLNGTLRNTTTSSSLRDASSDDDFRIGRNGQNPLQYDGLFDEWRIYDRALNSTEVQGLFMYPDGIIPTVTPTFSENYTISLNSNSYSGTSFISGSLTATCLDTSLNCSVDVYGVVDGLNATINSTPLLTPINYSFIVLSGSSETFYFTLQQNSVSSGLFGYNASNNQSVEASYSFVLGSDPFYGFGINRTRLTQIQLNYCPLSEGESDRLFYLVFISIAVVLFMFAFWVDNAFIGVLSSLLLIYTAIIGIGCDMFMGVLFLILALGGLLLSLSQLSMTKT